MKLEKNVRIYKICGFGNSRRMLGTKNIRCKKYDVDIVVMGSDWAGSDKFDYLQDYCEVVYLDRTEGISSTKIKRDLGLQDAKNGINQIPEVGSKKVR